MSMTCFTPTQFCLSHRRAMTSQYKCAGLPAFSSREISSSQERWSSEDPLGYVDGMDSYEYVRGNPQDQLDPLGLKASWELNADTGSNNEQRWIGANWRIWWDKVPNDPGNLLNNPDVFGKVLFRKQAATVTADNCKIHVRVDVLLRIYLRNRSEKPQVILFKGKDLTDVGRGVYGHEQLHEQDYITQLQQLVSDFADGIPEGKDAADCRRIAAKAQQELNQMVDAFVNARQPGGKGPDITHGGDGQPAAGTPNDPEGDPAFDGGNLPGNPVNLGGQR